jgi:cysteine desulfurase / selenocysteine lyase
VFSTHKMYAPYGGAAVVGLKDELNKHLPQFYGGGMVDVVSD